MKSETFLSYISLVMATEGLTARFFLQNSLAYYLRCLRIPNCHCSFTLALDQKFFYTYPKSHTKLRRDFSRSAKEPLAT